jgi:hypothetical protein
MGSFPLLICKALAYRIPIGDSMSTNQLQKPVAKVSKVFPAVKVVKHLRPCRVPHPVQPAHRIPVLRTNRFLKEKNLGDQIL